MPQLPAYGVQIRTWSTNSYRPTEFPFFCPRIFCPGLPPKQITNKKTLVDFLRLIFFQTWHWNFWREQKTAKKLPIIFLKQFCRPAHPFNCLQLMCIPVLMYIPYQHCKRKWIIRRSSMRPQNSTIPCHLLYVTRYYQTQSIFCVKCSYDKKLIGCAVVLYSLFYRSTKSSLVNLRSVQFFILVLIEISMSGLEKISLNLEEP